LAVFFPALIPVLLVEIAGIILLAIVILLVIYVLRRWHRSSIPVRLTGEIRKMPLRSVLTILLRTAISDGLAVYPLWRKSKTRWLGHALVFYGFIGLMITTTLDSIFNPQAYPLPLAHPIKVMGNVSGLAVLAGTPIILLAVNKGAGSIGLGDKIFMPTLILTVVSGFVTEAFSLGAFLEPSYIAYVIHLALAVVLLGSAPFTRFMHSVVAPYLILFDRYATKIGREEHLRGMKEDVLVQDLRWLLKKRE
jgi:hypothetical protein